MSVGQGIGRLARSPTHLGTGSHSLTDQAMARRTRPGTSEVMPWIEIVADTGGEDG